MFYRLTQATYSPDQHDAIVSYIESIGDEVRALAGLRSGAFIGTGPGEGVMIAAYESEDAFKAVEETINSMLGGVVPMLNGPPTTVSGTADWNF